MTELKWSWDDEGHSDRKDAIRRDIGRRLRHVCPDYPEEEFAQLVDEMADRQIKGERRASQLLE